MFHSRVYTDSVLEYILVHVSSRDHTINIIYLLYKTSMFPSNIVYHFALWCRYL